MKRTGSTADEAGDDAGWRCRCGFGLAKGHARIVCNRGDAEHTTAVSGVGFILAGVMIRHAAKLNLAVIRSALLGMMSAAVGMLTCFADLFRIALCVESADAMKYGRADDHGQRGRRRQDAKCISDGDHNRRPPP